MGGKMGWAKMGKERMTETERGTSRIKRKQTGIKGQIHEGNKGRISQRSLVQVHFVQAPSRPKHTQTETLNKP